MIMDKLFRLLGFKIHACNTKLTTTTYFARISAIILVLDGSFIRTNKNHFKLS